VAPSVKVDIGTVITTKGGEARGRIGAFLRNKDGQVVGLSARHILEADGSEDVLDSQSGAVIGRRISGSPLVGESESFNAIGSFRIVEGVGFEEGHLAGWISLRDIKIGSAASTLSHDILAYGGTVSAIGGSVRFQDPFTDKITHYLNLVEVTFAGRDIENVMRGRAGTLFVSERGQAIGILIAVSGERCLLAPLEPYAAKHSLVLNPPRRAIDGRSDNGEIKVDLGALQAEASLLREELRLGSAVFEDPEGLRPPDRLVKLLEETA
jgi:hypothetical protein